MPNPAEHHLLDVGHAVAVGILGVDNVRSDGDEHAAVVGNNSGRPRKPAEKDRPRVEPAVAIAVFETADVARGRFFRKRITPHLDDIKPPIGVVTDADRVGDQWLDGDRLEPKAWVNRNDSCAAAGSSGLIRGSSLAKSSS